ncbi:unnamed protein product [Urochloa humidicola]
MASRPNDTALNPPSSGKITFFKTLAVWLCHGLKVRIVSKVFRPIYSEAARGVSLGPSRGCSVGAKATT